MNVAAQRFANEKRSRRISCFVERQFAFELGGAHGSIAIGAATPPSKRDCCHVWTYPLPSVSLRQQLRHAKSIDVHEAGTHFASEKIRALFSAIPVDTRDRSAILLRSLAYHRVNTTPGVVEALERMLPDHPRFTESVVLTASLEARGQRLQMRRSRSPDDVAPDDLLVEREPAKFMAAERKLIGLATEYFAARVIDTSKISEREVTSQILDIASLADSVVTG